MPSEPHSVKWAHGHQLDTEALAVSSEPQPGSFSRGRFKRVMGSTDFWMKDCCALLSYLIMNTRVILCFIKSKVKYNTYLDFSEQLRTDEIWY